MKHGKSGKHGKEIARGLALITQIGLLMLIPILIGVGIGHFLDEKFGTGVLWLVVFTILGVFAAFRNLYVLAKRESK